MRMDVSAPKALLNEARAKGRREAPVRRLKQEPFFGRLLNPQSNLKVKGGLREYPKKDKQRVLV